MTLSKIISNMFAELCDDIVEGWIDLRDSLKSKKTRRETIEAVVGGVALFAGFIAIWILASCIAR